MNNNDFNAREIAESITNSLFHMPPANPVEAVIQVDYEGVLYRVEICARSLTYPDKGAIWVYSTAPGDDRKLKVIIEHLKESYPDEKYTYTRVSGDSQFPEIKPATTIVVTDG